MPRARLVPYQIWKYPRIHKLSKDARILLLDLYSSVDDDGIVEAFPILRIEEFGISILNELVGSAFIDILDEPNLIVFLEDHYRLNTFFRTQKYHPSKYRQLLFQRRPDIRAFFEENYVSAQKQIAYHDKDNAEFISLLSDSNAFNDYNYVIEACSQVDIPERLTQICLAIIARRPELHLSDREIFDIIKTIDERMQVHADVSNYEQYVKTAVENELERRFLI